METDNVEYTIQKAEKILMLAVALYRSIRAPGPVMLGPGGTDSTYF